MVDMSRQMGVRMKLSMVAEDKRNTASTGFVDIEDKLKRQWCNEPSLTQTASREVPEMCVQRRQRTSLMAEAECRRRTCPPGRGRKNLKCQRKSDCW